LFRHLGFNPVLGFYRIATATTEGSGYYRVEFQSRSGFLPHRDASSASMPVAQFPGFNPVLGFYRIATTIIEALANSALGFNPVLGFYRIATALGRDRWDVVDEVSIPFWVSTASRRGSRSSQSQSCSRFNPVLGFYRIATLLGQLRGPDHRVSIPFWVSTASRHGGNNDGTTSGTVSIPFWVSTASRQGVDSRG